jgi:hypothetical protein
MIIQIRQEQVPHDSLIRSLCTTPYHGRNQGCPNFADKEGCPPRPLINKVLDFEKELYIVYTEYPVGKYAEKMRLKHPEWKTGIYPDTPLKAIVIVNDSIETLKERHPDWPDSYFPERASSSWESSREWYNPIRWQGTARAELDLEIEKFLSEHPGCKEEKFPEACGVNLTGLMANIGIKLNWKWPHEHKIENITYRIALVGFKL